MSILRETAGAVRRAFAPGKRLRRELAPCGLYRNPLSTDDCPDPCVLRDGSEYYLYSTSSNRPDAYPIRRSRDLDHWTPAGHMFSQGEFPRWAVSDFWAPEVHRFGRRYLAYFTARDRSG